MPAPAKGDRFGSVVVLEPAAHSVPGQTRSLVRCDCGNTKTVLNSALRIGSTKSCGRCPHRYELTRGRAQKIAAGSGVRRRPLYSTWLSMIRRCHVPGSGGYPRYGGRGIRVCERWRSAFDAFERDMGPRPSPKHSLDRINNDGDYEPGNCRWATSEEQSRNRSTTVRISFRGEELTLIEWAKRYRIHPDTVRDRIRRGWAVDRALMSPPDRNPRRRVKP